MFIVKRIARFYLGPYYHKLVRLRNSNFSRILSASIYAPRSLLILARAKTSFPADVCGDMGMGAILCHVVRLLSYADTRNLIPAIVSRNRLYGDRIASENVLAGFRPGFALPSYSGRFISIKNEWDYKILGVSDHISIDEANRLFQKFMMFPDVVVEAADCYLRCNRIENFDLSVHYRATDKLIESAQVDFSIFFGAIRDLMSCATMAHKIFLATDSHLFEAALGAEFPDVAIFTFYRGKVRQGQPRHFSDMPGSEKALEALVNIILLSRASVCVRSSSYMSAWSKIINPGLVTKTLGRTYTNGVLFPEAEILAAEADAKNKL